MASFDAVPLSLVHQGRLDLGDPDGGGAESQGPVGLYSQLTDLHRVLQHALDG